LEGIFRIPPSKTQQDELVLKYNRGDNIELAEIFRGDQYSVPGLLQRYFRDLPDPLLTSEFHECFMIIHETKGKYLKK